MEESLIRLNASVPSHNEPAVVSQPGKGALHLPSAAVSSQHTSILSSGSFSIGFMRGNQMNTPTKEFAVQWVTIISLVGNHPTQLVLQLGRATAQGRIRQSHFRRRSAGKLASQRNTLAVDHHHPFRAFSLLGFAHAEPPFLEGAKLPSKNTSDHSKLPWASSCLRKTLQIFNHSPSRSHFCNRRQQVAGLG